MRKEDVKIGGKYIINNYLGSGFSDCSDIRKLRNNKTIVEVINFHDSEVIVIKSTDRHHHCTANMLDCIDEILTDEEESNAMSRYGKSINLIRELCNAINYTEYAYKSKKGKKVWEIFKNGQIIKLVHNEVEICVINISNQTIEYITGTSTSDQNAINTMLDYFVIEPNKIAVLVGESIQIVST